MERDHCGHVKGFAQEGMADLEQPGLALYAAARFVMPWVKSRERGGLPTVGETAGVGIERQDNRDGAFAQPWDGAGQFALLFQVGVVADVGVDGLDQALYFGVQPVQVVLDVVPHGIAGHVQAQHQRPQGQFGFAGGLPRGGLRSAQKLAMSLASTASVLVRARQEVL